MYIRGFDGLRAISILLVILTHLGLYDQIQYNNFLKQNFNLYSGGTGVVIFFSISGFLITSLLLNEKEKNGGINFKYFFIRRFLRLLPPFIVFFLLVGSLMAFSLLPKEYLALSVSFFYLYNYVPVNWYVTELGHTWSLGVEEQFYLMWPFIINRIKRFSRGFTFALTIIAICFCWKFVYSEYSILEIKNKIALRDYFFIDRWFIPACMPIMIGSLSAMVLHAYRNQCASFFSNNYWILIFSFILYTAQVYFPELSFHFTGILMPSAVSLLLIWIIFNQHNFIVNLLEFKPINFIGRISYGLYVYQGLFLRTGPGGNLKIQQFPLNIILTFSTAILSYYFIEKKIMHFKKRFSVVVRSH